MQGLMSDFPLTLPHAFGRAERLFAGKRIATATRGGIEATTYGEWAERTRRLGGALATLGLSADARVGTFAWNSARHLELYFAAPCTGRVLHTLNIRLFPEQLVYVVEHAADEAVFVDRSLLPIFWPHVEQMGSVAHIVVMDDGGEEEIPDDPRVRDYEELIASAEPAEFEVTDENRAAAMCYTSGTTGHPKGVVYSHRSSLLHALGTMVVDSLAVSESDVILPVVPMFHANAWGLAHAAVMAGASLVMPGSDLSPAAIANLIESQRVTCAAGVPTIWRGVLPELDGRDFSSLKRIVGGGSAVPKSLSEAYREKIGIPILHSWGMTEMSPLGSVCRIRSELSDRADEELADIRTSIGLIAPFVECRIVEPGSGEELPWDGESQGELQVRGPWIAASYYDDDERSSESFTEDGWLRSGDVATIDSHGYIRLVDRTKDVIKSGGEWISSVELENEIMAHPKVKEAAVIGISDQEWGERPLACVVPEEGEELSSDEIRSFLQDKVPKWWLPEAVEMIDEVPKTSVGKFSKKDLRERFAGQAG
jgi:acyl-CoA synthetase (AMP-forming)/AMP-acid ligase II